jgi:hypothetical protein
LTAVVLALPVLIALTPTFFSSALPRAVYRGLRYLSSVWSFGAAGVVAVTIGNAREEEAETPS